MTNGLSSSNLITVTNLTHTKTENLVSIGTVSSLVFNGSTYPLASNTTTVTPFTGSTLNIFQTFPNKTFSYPIQSTSLTIKVEGPCSIAASSFSYTFSPVLPTWLTYSATGSSSTQTFTVAGSPLAAASLVKYSGQLTNDAPFVSQTIN